MTRELPVEWLSAYVVPFRESMNAIPHRLQTREVVRCERFALEDGEIDLDLVQPARVNWQRNSVSVSELAAEATGERRWAMRASLIDDPEDPTSRLVWLAGHDLLHKPMEWVDATGLLDATVDLRPMNIKSGEVCPRTATLVLVLVLYALPSSVGADFRAMNPDPRLDAGLLVGGDDELVGPQRPLIPLAGVEIQDFVRSLLEQQIAGPYPRTVPPGLESVGVEDSPDRRQADRRDVFLGYEDPVDVRNEQPTQRLLMLGRKFTRDALDGRDQPRGGKTVDAPCGVCPGERIPHRPNAYASFGPCSRGLSTCCHHYGDT